MKLAQLKYVSAIAQEGSLSNAARALGMAQPALSQQVKALEVELDTQLFFRTPRGTELTSSGRILVEHARTILDQIDMAHHDIQMNGQQIGGETSLMIAHAIAGYILPTLLSKLHDLHPQIKLRVTPASSVDVQTALENSRIDIGVLPDREGLTKVNAKPVLSQPLFFVRSAAGSARKSGDKNLSFADAVDYPLVVTRRNQPFREQLERLAKEHSVELDARYESNSVLMMTSYVESGLACSILPWSAIAEKVALGRMKAQKIVEPTIQQSYIVAWPKSRPLNRPSAAVRDILASLHAELREASFE
jgi:LysR family nitrogen assimilation transcriptional regulator